MTTHRSSIARRRQLPRRGFVLGFLAGWPRGVNMLLASLANGLVVGMLVVVFALVVGGEQ